jgi:hypothetical protein
MEFTQVIESRYSCKNFMRRSPKFLLGTLTTLKNARSSLYAINRKYAKASFISILLKNCTPL